MIECTGSITSSAYACYHVIRVLTSGHLFQLLFNLKTYNRLETRHHFGIRMRSYSTAYKIECLVRSGTPCCKCGIDCIVKSGVTRGHRYDGGPEHLHAKHIRTLPLYILGAHIYRTLQTKQSGNRGCGNTMLSGSGFSYDTPLAHALREQT